MSTTAEACFLAGRWREQSAQGSVPFYGSCSGLPTDGLPGRAASIPIGASMSASGDSSGFQAWAGIGPAKSMASKNSESLLDAARRRWGSDSIEARAMSWWGSGMEGSWKEGSTGGSEERSRTVRKNPLKHVFGIRRRSS